MCSRMAGSMSIYSSFENRLEFSLGGAVRKTYVNPLTGKLPCDILTVARSTFRRVLS